MAEALKIGDVVRLKTGGPKMTVAELREPDDDEMRDLTRLSAECIWFTQMADGGWSGLYRDVIPVDLLEIVKDA